MTSWIVLQLADSAFPTGGFAHSAGLEAHVQAGELASLDTYCREFLDQLALGSLPLVSAVHDGHADPARLADVDAFARATLWNHVAARASRAQGRALLDVAARSFGVAKPTGIEGHLAPAFGYVTRSLGVDRDEALASFLHLGLRGLLSAAVRLGCAGPSEAQALHLHLHPALEAALARGRALTLADVAQPSPLVELIQGTHDRLYSRLFQS
ncbi:MAG TPA: urease accessory UreF family protein [Kofleriaceae bacterium]|nr:urease accessory UreF family protein [Kofleriaceae bacterium]